MHTTFKISLLISAVFIIIIGLFLLIYNLNLINESILIFIINLWPLLLIISGSLLFFDSFRKKRFRKKKEIITKDFPLDLYSRKNEIQFNIKFSYGEFYIESAKDKIHLTTIQNDFFPEPVINLDNNGTLPCIDISISKPLLPSPVFLIHKWNLFCKEDIKHNFNIEIHESDILLDFLNIPVETLRLKGDLGNHKIIIGNKQNKFNGKIYSYSKNLTLVLPQNIFAKIHLLNQFCRIDYPQGDFTKSEDGIFVYNADKSKTIEILIDGPVNHLLIDIEDKI